MDTYYDEEGKVLGHAWSAMECTSNAEHTPHSHRPEHTIYGPYMCPGIPEISIFNTPPADRKPAFIMRIKRRDHNDT